MDGTNKIPISNKEINNTSWNEQQTSTKALNSVNADQEVWCRILKRW